MTDPIRNSKGHVSRGQGKPKPPGPKPPAAPPRAKDEFKRTRNGDAQFAAAATRAAVETATPAIEALTGGKVSGFSISVSIGDQKATEKAKK